MQLTMYHVARAKPANRRRLARALGLRANATIAQIVQAANWREVTVCRWPCPPGDGHPCASCTTRWGAL